MPHPTTARLCIFRAETSLKQLAHGKRVYRVRYSTANSCVKCVTYGEWCTKTPQQTKQFRQWCILCRTHPLQGHVEVLTSPSPSFGWFVLGKLRNNLCWRRDSNPHSYGTAYTTEDATTLPRPQSCVARVMPWISFNASISFNNVWLRGWSRNLSMLFFHMRRNVFAFAVIRLAQRRPH